MQEIIYTVITCVVKIEAKEIKFLSLYFSGHINSWHDDNRDESWLKLVNEKMAVINRD